MSIFCVVFANCLILGFNLLAGSFQFDTQLPEKMEEEEEDKGESPLSSEDDNSGKKKRKVRKISTESDEALPGPSAQLTPRQKKKSKKIYFCKSPAHLYVSALLRCLKASPAAHPTC